MSAGHGGPLYRIPSADSIMEDGNSLSGVRQRLLTHIGTPIDRFYSKKGYVCEMPSDEKVRQWYQKSVEYAVTYQYKEIEYEQGLGDHRIHSPSYRVEVDRHIDRWTWTVIRHANLSRLRVSLWTISWIFRGNEMDDRKSIGAVCDRLSRHIRFLWLKYFHKHGPLIILTLDGWRLRRWYLDATKEAVAYQYNAIEYELGLVDERMQSPCDRMVSEMQERRRDSFLWTHSNISSLLRYCKTVRWIFLGDIPRPVPRWVVPSRLPASSSWNRCRPRGGCRPAMSISVSGGRYRKDCPKPPIPRSIRDPCLRGSREPGPHPTLWLCCVP